MHQIEWIQGNGQRIRAGSQGQLEVLDHDCTWLPNMERVEKLGDFECIEYCGLLSQTCLQPPGVVP
jgi:hypothetical protein